MSSRMSSNLEVVAIGGGTGLPSVLRGMKHFTNNITAIVTVTDDGGSSGVLRRDYGWIPPGDLRNNLVALSDSDSLLARLLQYRFEDGELAGHSFGNLFIGVLAKVAGSIEVALTEIEYILNIRGRVLPSTLNDVSLVGKLNNHTSGIVTVVKGETMVTNTIGSIEEVALDPANVKAYPESIRAISSADVVILGPGSLYTSILPNLLVQEIGEALSNSRALKIYVCNIAEQPGETDNYTVADHVLALEHHVGKGLFQIVLANNNYPESPVGNTKYVSPVPQNHEILQRYQIKYIDLADHEQPWRHDPHKLAAGIISLIKRMS